MLRKDSQVVLTPTSLTISKQQHPESTIMSVLTFSTPPQFFGGDFFSPPFHHHSTAATTTTPTAGCKKARRSFVLGRCARDHTVTETEDAFQLFVDLPGVKATDISLQIHEGVLKISGSRKFGGGQQQSSAFVKSFSTDEADIDTSNITANLSDGVLAVTFPKRAKPTVTVKTITVTENPHEDLVAVDSKMDITDEEGNTAKKEQDDKSSSDDRNTTEIATKGRK